MAYYDIYEDGEDGDWVDLVALDATLSGNVVLVQNRNPAGTCAVVFGGSKPTRSDAGIGLKELHAVPGSGTSIWVRSDGGFKVSVQDKE